MGLTEANQILTLNNLRHNVTLRTDGGLKTGRDVVVAAMMGAKNMDGYIIFSSNGMYNG